MAEVEAAPASVPELKPKVVVYCGVCSLPPEYCEFGGTLKKCEEWLEAHHPDLHSTLYSSDAVTNTLADLSLAQRAKAEKDSAKKTARAEAASAREADRKANSRITIRRVERNKRKYVTTVSGLEQFGLDLKKVAKELGKKFASGASVTKVAAGGEEITVQGDLSEDIFEWMVDHYEEVPEENVELVDEKKKKAAAAG